MRDLKQYMREILNEMFDLEERALRMPVGDGTRLEMRERVRTLSEVYQRLLLIGVAE